MSIYCTLPRGQSAREPMFSSSTNPTSSRSLFRRSMPPLPPPPPVPKVPKVPADFHQATNCGPLPPPPPPLSSISSSVYNDGGQCYTSSSHLPAPSFREENSLAVNLRADQSEVYLTNSRQSQVLNSTYASHQVAVSTGPNSSSPSSSETIQPKIYYAVDSYEDLKAIRRNSISNLTEDLNPNFYGDDDSAYDSTSNESLGLSVKDVRKLKGSSNKYFTLPSRLRRKMKKMNFADAEAAQAASVQKSKSYPLSASDAAVLMERMLCSSDQYSTYRPVSSAGSLPEERERDRHSLPPPPPPSRHSSYSGGDGRSEHSTSSNKSEDYQCCCLSDCGSASVGNSSETSGGLTPSNYEANHKLHCCQQTLETLWEEPHQANHELFSSRESDQIYAAMSMQLRRSSLSDCDRQMEMQRLGNDKSTLRQPQAKHDQERDNLNSQQSGWLKGNFLRAFRRSKPRPKSVDLSVTGVDGGSAYDRPQISDKHAADYLANNGCYPTYANQSTNYNNLDVQILQHFHRQLAQKDELIRELQNESKQNLSQIESLKLLVTQMRQEIEYIKKENERLENYVSTSPYSLYPEPSSRIMATRAPPSCTAK